MARVEFDERLKGHRLAFMRDGSLDELGDCGFFWLGGFKSDMTGSKAETLSALAHATRRTFLRFDYSGHGQSSGAFEDGTISQWLEQATHMFITQTRNKRIIVGSSMGGWLALLLARKLREEDPKSFRRIGGIVLIAPATDMTHDLMWQLFSPEQKHGLATRYFCEMPSGYGEPYVITMPLIEDGYNHMLLKDGMNLPFPLRILQGTRDESVPTEHAVRTFESIVSQDSTLTFIKGGDHRLSTPPQLAIIREAVLRLAERADGIEI
jgi:pimeloyl-ACP methyl ester carboxylesterase